MEILALRHGQKITFSGTAAQSVAFVFNKVRLHCTEDCHVAVGVNPTATATYPTDRQFFMPSGNIEYISVGREEKISVIQESTGGSLFVSEGEYTPYA